PDKPAITPCSYALKKLDKGEYVELWYFTNDGLDEASIKKTIDDDAMILSTLADGSTAWVSSASTRSARSVINDENLPFEEFCQACPRFLTAIEEADWPQDRVRMMARFWMNIQVHKFRSLRDPIAQKSLLVYQAEQRKRWHIAAKSSVGPYDLSDVNEKVLKDTRDRVYWDERNKRDNERDYKTDQHVSSSSRHRDWKEPTKRAHSPEHASKAKKPRQDFRAGASGGVLSACAICLGRNPHRIIECKASRTWDDAFETLCA
ncbi:uncharacterized protein HD556DRAFT_1455260, partial [Suillus plorans]